MRIGIRRRTRDRVWRVGTKDSTANIPVIGGDVVPAGPPRRGCRWAHLVMGSRAQVKGVGPPRWRLRRSSRWPCWRMHGYRGRDELDGVDAVCRALGLSQQLVHGGACCGLPRFEHCELVQHLGHDGVEAIKLLHQIFHGRRHLGFKLGGLAWSQSEATPTSPVPIRSPSLYLSGAREVGRRRRRNG